jgi:uncharacterized protein YbjT (DUF2867 family)
MHALVLGASGLVGHELVELLILDKRFKKIDLLSRRELDVRDIKVTNHVVNFAKMDYLPIHHSIDVLFIAFGTTIKKAGSQRNQYRIDVGIPARVMRMAKSFGTPRCVLVSSMGVNKYSPFFYARMKAELDQIAKESEFEQLIIVKPSVLEGPRNERRRAEEFSVLVGNTLAKTGIFNRIRPVLATDVAKCMIQAVTHYSMGTFEITSDEIHQLARQYTSDMGNL